MPILPQHEVRINGPGNARDSRGLTRRQAKFVEEYVKDYNSYQAALRAGYTPSSANMAAVAVLRRPNVKRAIEQIQDAAARRTVKKAAASSERIIQEYEHLALLDPIDMFNVDGSLKALHEMPEGARRALLALKMGRTREGQHYTREVKFGKLGALDSLARINGMMVDNQVQVGVGLNIHIHTGEYGPPGTAREVEDGTVATEDTAAATTTTDR